MVVVDELAHKITKHHFPYFLAPKNQHPFSTPFMPTKSDIALVGKSLEHVIKSVAKII
jgi:hypothetical protein